jgi:hypothetical protein
MEPLGEKLVESIILQERKATTDFFFFAKFDIESTPIKDPVRRLLGNPGNDREWQRL